MTIEEIQPFLEVIIQQNTEILESLSSITNLNSQILDSLYRLQEITALLAFFIGVLCGLIFMRILWERFR